MTPENLFDMVRRKKLDLSVPKNENLDEKNIKTRPNNYYQYQLVGVVVHSGISEGGHYYSYIRDRIPNQKSNKVECEQENNSTEKRSSSELKQSPDFLIPISFPPSSSAQWYHFNDSEVKVYDINNLPEDCFGEGEGTFDEIGIEVSFLNLIMDVFYVFFFFFFFCVCV
jgi:hypothetical protein